MSFDRLTQPVTTKAFRSLNKFLAKTFGARKKMNSKMDHRRSKTYKFMCVVTTITMFSTRSPILNLKQMRII